MRQLFSLLAIFTVIAGIFYSCAKYKDPSPKNLNLTNPYCNDPNAVNYNVGFPGRADSTVCIYPSEEFVGTYVFHDSVYNDTLFIFTDSLVLRISVLSHNKFIVRGLCKDTTVSETFSASKTLIATGDTTIGDTTTLNLGQYMCRYKDTLTGTITRDAIDSNLLHLVLQVVSDTGLNMHLGSARKQ